MTGWLLDTNVIASLIAPEGAPSVRRWAEARAEDALFISILTLGEYDKGIANLPGDHPKRALYAEARDRLEARFTDRVLPLSNAIVRRWGAISGAIKRDTSHAPPVIDTLLAATAIEHGLILATRNVRDVAETGAVVFNPWDAG